MSSKNKLLSGFSAVGDSAVLLELGSKISFTVNDQVRILDQQMAQTPQVGVIEWVPAYSSMLVHYDPLQIKLLEVQEWILVCLRAVSLKSQPHPKRVTVLVRYGGEDGPDLENVADFHGLTSRDVVIRHSAGTYRVGMMGFTPGFAYLIGMDPQLATPRLKTPRTLVPKGSVGIAEMQTGIYPLDSPGGWQLIGRTDQVMFDPYSEPHFLLSPGDEVTFVPSVDGAVS